MKIRHLSITAGVIIAAIIFSWFFEDLIREAVILPLSYVLWIVRLIFESFNQEAIWVSFIIVAIIIVLFSLSPITRRTKKNRREENDSLDRVEMWAARLRATDRGDYLKWRLAQHLVSLTFETLSYWSGKPSQQIIEELEKGNLVTTPEINSYLKVAINSKQLSTSQNIIFKKNKPSYLDLDIDHLLSYLEKLLESYG